ncbi:(2Fe-2S)-binding protein [Komagataeibacter intermedius]|uniref:(2Fe-2S)-binding protein n=2 Tax=Komagataeibacter intermedius TaxID=66229 RepID=A0A0N0MDT0_9PROT|nr:(2Fe-2S)-binding protein [Komagataeibacter intermedius]KPH85646.1 (2Fe-2S)-binding protein [Komagataeibacter intermedius AF2]MCF3637634.1 (2Fe-2S)-binding protein [Komagataeibacter intermedius]GAN87315.1 aldehyde dehydrogenase small subunit/oxidoreductase [Komagataeibacter intermedius TF2]GBQ75684.1 oxidoreductase iron-sulfur subunit [Komagataeibacter intermedius NRIC 0521]
MTRESVAVPCHLQINGQDYSADLPPSVTLLDLLRERLDLTGTKKGCDHGQCGACTVLVDGKRVKSCLILAVSIPDATVTTIEGIAQDGRLHPMQQAFIDADAFQCGYCTPGQIMSAIALLEESHVHSRAEIREFMSGNLCRCGAYNGIIDAIERVVSQQHRNQAGEAA